MPLSQADAMCRFTAWLARQPHQKVFGTQMDRFYTAHPEAKANLGKMKSFMAISEGRLTYYPNAHPGKVFVKLNEVAAAGYVSDDRSNGSEPDGAAQANPSTATPRPVQRSTAALRSRTSNVSAGRGGTLETRMVEAERRRQPPAMQPPRDDTGSEVPAEVDDRVWERFYAETPRRDGEGRVREVLFGGSNRPSELDSALFGRAQLSGDGHDGATEHVYLNVSEPFCLIAIGVQGSGKSHTAAVVAESCLMRCDAPTRAPLVRLREPAAALVLHYGRHEKDACELTGLLRPADAEMWGGGASTVPPPCVGRAVVLVSPSFYAQRKRYYGEEYDVRPLLFRWDELTAAHLRMLMRLDDEGAQQLYISVLLDLLRQYQQKDTVPEFADFTAEVQEMCGSASQAGPLKQRLQILESFILESERNADMRTDALSVPLDDLVASGVLVIADLTDPMLSAADASAVFGVLLEQFRRSESGAAASKLVVLDEAHRYLHGRGGLAGSLVDAVRVMRHEGLRVCVSTQSPLELPPELLELASLAVLHGFHSNDWYKFLASKLNLPDGGFDLVRHLLPGEALVSARCLAVPGFGDTVGSFRVQVRPRLTSDLGASRST